MQITGLVLAGGAGRRVGGADKGLLPHAGRPLVEHALSRLAPQVGRLAVSANRHLPRYAGFGVAVHADSLPGLLGPLAGMLTGLEHCSTPWMVTVPCDVPRFPHDLVARLAEAAQSTGANLAVAAIPDEAAGARRQPVFCLMKISLQDALRAFLLSGERKVGDWVEHQRGVHAVFHDRAAFDNFNTLDALQP